MLFTPRKIAALVLLLVTSTWAQPASKNWFANEKEVYKKPSELKRQNRREHKQGYHPLKVMRGPVDRPEVMLTFDDGPHPQTTMELLKILARHHVTATFFVVGKMAARHPELIQAIHAGGHTLANHSYSHRNMTRVSLADLPREFSACQEVVEKACGVKMTEFRPPGGQYNKAVAKASQKQGYLMVLWTDDPGDYANPGAQLIESRTVAGLSPGAVILLHDGSPQTLEILDSLLDAIKKKGLTCVSPARMFHRPKQ